MHLASIADERAYDDTHLQMKAMACDTLQGFCFSRPQPPRDTLALPSRRWTLGAAGSANSDNGNGTGKDFGKDTWRRPLAAGQ